MDKLIEELTYFAYDGERDFFDITRSEAKSFLNELGKKDDEIERLNNVIDKKEQFLGDNIKRLEREIINKNNIINELEKYLIEQVEKSYSNDYDNVLDKLDELKGSDKE